MTSIISRLRDIPDSARHVMLEFLGFTLHNRRYIGRIPRDLPIFRYLTDRPLIKYGTEEDEDGYMVTDETRTFVSFDLGFKLLNRHCYEVKVLEIHFGVLSNSFIVVKKYYEIEFDGSRNPTRRNYDW